ncbi:expressed unknown protein [Seminavis robusta]|uniref:TauD/TfdA-like domain-containing protein n=1 Tax=Seminavis robusta TaxID=568900 RepID=A0A9N8HDP2_9STRA|nr:expressed unknown protein [Seminavis robusta]|eukprot:Sro436_g142530.1 n/a (220) ;mRNA; f:9201-9860
MKWCIILVLLDELRFIASQTQRKEERHCGGETLLAYNRDHSKNISPKLQQFVKDHGGILHRREYRSKHTIIERGNNQEGSSSQFDPMTWQDKTKATTREEAIQYFKRLGCDPVYFDPNDTLIAENMQSGFNEQGDWFNNLYPIVDSLPGKWPLGGLADGAYIPREMIERLQIDVWKAVKVLRLRPGDWLVLNNRSVQHGRLPFEESAHQKRLILTVYTE